MHRESASIVCLANLPQRIDRRPKPRQTPKSRLTPFLCGYCANERGRLSIRYRAWTDVLTESRWHSCWTQLIVYLIAACRVDYRSLVKTRELDPKRCQVGWHTFARHGSNSPTHEKIAWCRFQYCAIGLARASIRVPSQRPLGFVRREPAKACPKRLTAVDHRFACWLSLKNCSLLSCISCYLSIRGYLAKHHRAFAV